MLDIARQLLKITNLPEQTKLVFPGDVDKQMQPGTSIGQQDATSIFPFGERILIEVEEEYERDRLLSTAVMRPENLFIFRDDLLETAIKPVYSETALTLTFHYRAKDKIGAQRWRDDIRTKVSMDRDIHLHNLTYHYLVPPEFLYILKEIHRMRENVDGYNEVYDVYFKDRVTQRASLLTNLSGSQSAWGISETQMRVVGWFDFEGVPERGSKEDDGDTWTISFSYKFRYDKPIACSMHYPLMIHNQLLDQKYRPDEPVYDVTEQLSSYTSSSRDFTYFEKGRKRVTVPGYAVPSFDEFIPTDILIDTMRIITALVSIDTTATNPKLLMNLRELGDIELNPIILDFLVKETPFICKPYHSIFTLSLYRSILLAEADEIQIDADLNIYSKDDLSLRNYYHVRLALVTNLNLLTESALLRLRNSGLALQLLLDAIDPTLKLKDVDAAIAKKRENIVYDEPGIGLIPPVLRNDYVTREDLQIAIDEINREILVRGDGQIYQFNTVQVLMVQSKLETVENVYRRKQTIGATSA